ncbi:MAG TPA: FAD-dependent oxidoreductase, partial [Mycobacterium sp.]|nr:FAD-dependent oxidoreductase [Mycobacterium sp.]
MLTARELALAGLSVTLLERGVAGREASWAGGGIISPLYPWRYPDAVSRLANWGQSRYEALAEALRQESGIDPEWTLSGMLVLDDAETEQALNWARRFETRIEVVGAREVTAAEPAVSARFDDGLWMPDIAQIRNPRLVKAARGALGTCGVDLQEGIEVVDLLVANGRVQGVETSGGKRWADRVVIAAGAWSSKVLQSLDLRVEIIPVRGQMIVFRARPGVLGRIVLNHGHYLIPRRDGRILAGSTLEYVGYDKSTTEPAKTELLKAALEMVPGL